MSTGIMELVLPICSLIINRVICISLHDRTVTGYVFAFAPKIYMSYSPLLRK